MFIPNPTLSQITWQLITSWGDVNEGEYRYWPKSVITYAIPDVAPWGTQGEHLGFEAMSPFMKEQTRLAFKLWDDLIAPSLRETPWTSADITVAKSYNTQNGPNAYAYPSYLADQGTFDLLGKVEIWMHPYWANGSITDGGFLFGNHGFETVVHEIGHALGLSHPGSYNFQADYRLHAEYPQDTLQYTIMSYFTAGSDINVPIHGRVEPQTPLLHDVMAIQALYGADMTTRTGSTTYGFYSNADRPVFDFTKNLAPVVCIWDAGGNDTLNLSGYGYGQVINLQAGSFSSVMGLTANLSIAYNCTIENAIGGGGADRIGGNAAANWLSGGAGNDQIFGFGGHDSIHGGAGNDHLWGGGGADRFYFYGGIGVTNGVDYIRDFQVGIDRVLLDDALFGANHSLLPGLLKTQAQGWAWLDLPGTDAVVFWGVTEAALESRLDSFVFF